MPIIKKRVKPINEQDPFESRRLWKDVTLNLKKKDVHEATKYKQMLEQRQREEAKQRAETGEPIKHKVTSAAASSCCCSMLSVITYEQFPFIYVIVCSSSKKLVSTGFTQIH